MAQTGSKCISSRLSTCAFLLVLASSFAWVGSAHAQEPASASADVINGWFDGLNAHDTVSASYETIEPGKRRDSVTVNKGVISVFVPSEELFDTADLGIKISFDSIIFTGLTQTDTHIAANQIEIPGAFDITIGLAPEEKLAPAPLQDDKETADTNNDVAKVPETPGSSISSYQGVLIEGFSAPRAIESLKRASSSPKVFARTAFDAFREIKINRAFVETLTSATRSADTNLSNSSSKDLVIIGMADGRIAEQSVDEFEVNELLTPATDGNPIETQRFLAGPVYARGFDIAPLAGLLDGKTDPERTTLLDRKEILNIEFSSAGANGQLGGILVENVTVQAQEPLAIFDLLEAEMNGTPVSEEKLGVAVLQALGTFSVGRFEFSNLSVDSREADVDLRRLLLREVSGRGLGELSVEDLELAIDGSGNASVDHIGIGKVKFPAIAALIALDGPGEPTSQQILAALPRVGHVLSSKLYSRVQAEADTEEVELELALFEIRQGYDIGNIPTNISLILDGLIAPVNAIDDPEFKALLTGLKIEELEFNQSFAAGWDPVTKDFVISDLTLSLRDGGNASFSLALGNVPESLFTNPEAAQLALVGATFKSAKLQVEGADIISAFLKEESSRNQISEELMVEGLVDAMRGDLGPLTDTAFGGELLSSLRGFLKDPDELTVAFEPQAPVPMTEILGLALTSPQLLPERLGARIAANAR